MTTMRTALGTLLAVIATWLTIGLAGPHDIAGPIFAVIATMVIAASGTILHFALTHDEHVRVTRW